MTTYSTTLLYLDCHSVRGTVEPVPVGWLTCGHSMHY